MAMTSLLSTMRGCPATTGPSRVGVPEIEYPSPLAELPDEPLLFVVKNTFVDTASCQPSSLLGSSAFQPRGARSCPGSKCAGGLGLESRCEPADDAGTSGSRSRSTSAGASTAGDDDSAAAAQALPEFSYPPPDFSVHNTFIDVSVGRLSSMLHEAFEERRIHSCPPSSLGEPGAWVSLSDAAARLTAQDEDFTPAPAPSSRCAEEDGDDFTPAPAAPRPPMEDEGWEAFVPAPLPRWASIDVFEDLAPEHPLPPPTAGEERWEPLAFAPPPPPPPAAPPLLPAEGTSPPSVIAQPPLGSPECPTLGSQFHCLGTCRPCAHAFTKGCANGVGCQFCHLCEPGELKRRQKERRIQIARQEASERPAEVGSSTRGRRGGQKARGRPSPGEPPAGVPSPMAPALECQTRAHV